MSSVLKKHIKNKTAYIDEAKKLLNNIDKDIDKVRYLEYLLNFLIKNVTEYMSDSFIENELNKIADSIHNENKIKHTDEKILHVMTEAYGTGGHTRLAELFIKNISSKYKQDILLTRQTYELPNNISSLECLDQKYLLKNKDIFDKSKELFKIASEYEYIVLHTHKDDVLVNLTFGTTKFKRPVLFVNHADHAFWCGGSVADMVLELSGEGMEFSKKIRGIKHNKVMNIPIEKKESSLTKKEARKNLSIKKNKKIILSIATEYKYGSTKDEVSNFINMAKNIVKDIDNCEFILIGPSIDNKYWREAYDYTSGKINPIGMQSREILEQYTSAADLYIESFPFSSYSAYLEVLNSGLQSLTLKNEIFSLDIAKKYALECISIEDIENKAKDILSSNHKEKYTVTIEEHLEDKWSENMFRILENLKFTKHNVYKLDGEKADVQYLNYTDKVIGRSSGFNHTYKKLSIVLKLKLTSLMLKYFLF